MSSGDSCNFTRTEWAQRSDLLYITFCVEDCKDANVTFEPTKIIFHGEHGIPPVKHVSEIEFYKEINPKKSEWSQTQRSVFCKVYKKVDEMYWPRLLKTNAKQHWLKVDFNRYKDESDSDEDDDNTPMAGQPDLSEMMAQMGRGAGTSLDDLDDNEDDSDDSDDEDVPDLEPAPVETEMPASEQSPKLVENGAEGEAAELQSCDA